MKTVCGISCSASRLCGTGCSVIRSWIRRVRRARLFRRVHSSRFSQRGEFHWPVNPGQYTIAGSMGGLVPVPVEAR